VDFNEDKHLDVCQSIEVGLKQQYELQSELTDILCVFALDAAKTAIKQRCGYAKNEKVTDHPLAQGIIARRVFVGEERIGKINGLTFKEYHIQIDKIKRRVNRHSTDGQRAITSSSETTCDLARAQASSHHLMRTQIQLCLKTNTYR
jgi:hypothetical protein